MVDIATTRTRESRLPNVAFPLLLLACAALACGVTYALGPRPLSPEYMAYVAGIP
jgi:hypothetical protein